MENNLVLLLIGGGIVLSLFVMNIYCTKRYGKPSRLLSFLCFFIAIITVLYNMYNLYLLDTDNTLMTANGIALVCILISAKRSLKKP